MKARLHELQKDEEVAWSARHYEQAATARAERLALEKIYNEKRAAWQQEQGLDEIVDAADIAEVIAKWTGRYNYRFLSEVVNGQFVIIRFQREEVSK